MLPLRRYSAAQSLPTASVTSTPNDKRPSWDRGIPIEQVRASSFLLSRGPTQLRNCLANACVIGHTISRKTSSTAFRLLLALLEASTWSSLSCFSSAATPRASEIAFAKYSSHRALLPTVLPLSQKNGHQRSIAYATHHILNASQPKAAESLTSWSQRNTCVERQHGGKLLACLLPEDTSSSYIPSAGMQDRAGDSCLFSLQGVLIPAKPRSASLGTAAQAKSLRQPPSPPARSQSSEQDDRR